MKIVVQYCIFLLFVLPGISECSELQVDPLPFQEEESDVEPFPETINMDELEKLAVEAKQDADFQQYLAGNGFSGFAFLLYQNNVVIEVVMSSSDKGYVPLVSMDASIQTILLNIASKASAETVKSYISYLISNHVNGNERKIAEPDDTVVEVRTLPVIFPGL